MTQLLVTGQTPLKALSPTQVSFFERRAAFYALIGHTPESLCDNCSNVLDVILPKPPKSRKKTEPQKRALRLRGLLSDRDFFRGYRRSEAMDMLQTIWQNRQKVSLPADIEQRPFFELGTNLFDNTFRPEIPPHYETAATLKKEYGGALETFTMLIRREREEMLSDVPAALRLSSPSAWYFELCVNEQVGIYRRPNRGSIAVSPATAEKILNNYGHYLKLLGWKTASDIHRNISGIRDCSTATEATHKKLKAITEAVRVRITAEVQTSYLASKTEVIDEIIRQTLMRDAFWSGGNTTYYSQALYQTAVDLNIIRNTSGVPRSISTQTSGQVLGKFLIAVEQAADIVFEKIKESGALTIKASSPSQTNTITAQLTVGSKTM